MAPWLLRRGMKRLSSDRLGAHESSTDLHSQPIKRGSGSLLLEGSMDMHANVALGISVEVCHKADATVRLGLTLADPDPDYVHTACLIVAEIAPDGAIAQQGSTLRPGDRVIAVNGKRVVGNHEAASALLRAATGQVKMKVVPGVLPEGWTRGLDTEVDIEGRTQGRPYYRSPSGSTFWSHPASTARNERSRTEAITAKEANVWGEGGQPARLDEVDLRLDSPAKVTGHGDESNIYATQFRFLQAAQLIIESDS